MSVFDEDRYTSAAEAYRGIHRMLGEYLMGWTDPPERPDGWREMLTLAGIMREIEGHTDVHAMIRDRLAGLDGEGE